MSIHLLLLYYFYYSTFQNDEIDDIDLSDPELNKAAVKIQASFRGHMVRKEHEEEIQHNNTTK